MDDGRWPWMVAWLAHGNRRAFTRWNHLSQSFQTGRGTWLPHGCPHVYGAPPPVALLVAVPCMLHHLDDAIALLHVGRMMFPPRFYCSVGVTERRRARVGPGEEKELHGAKEEEEPHGKTEGETPEARS